MKIRSFLCYFLLSPLVLIAQEQDMVERFYPVDPTRWLQVKTQPSKSGDPNVDPFGGASEHSAKEVDLKFLFVRYGVEFPEGSFVVYDPLISQLRVKNTPEMLERLERILRKTGVDVRQVYLNLWAVKFDANELEALERKSGRPLREEEYFELWKKKKGKQVFSQGLRTVHGVNALMEVSLEDGEKVLSDLGLNFTPTVGNYGQINLVLLPAQTLEADEEKKDAARQVSWTLASSVVMQNEESIVLCHSSTPDGVHRLVFFLHAKILEEARFR